MTNTNVLKDETLGGIEREYREVKRVATVGETVKYTWPGKTSHYDVVTNVCADGSVDCEHYVDAEGKDVYGYSLNAYVVLEPTDIVRVNGERYRMVERKAAVGERVVVIEQHNHRFSIGDIYEVSHITQCGTEFVEHPMGTRREGGKRLASIGSGAEYRVLEPVQPAVKSATIDTTVDGLLETVANLSVRVAELERLIKPIHSRESFQPEKLAELSRDAIVKRAKADVAELVKRSRSTRMDTPTTSKFGDLDVEFILNRTKRAVVALLRDYWTSNETVRSRGVAKCAPGDVFNSHIGRAIALRRALGLEVPAEYLNAPKPVEPKVGDIVEWNNADDRFTITKIDHNRYSFLDHSAGYGEKEINDIYYPEGVSHHCRVIDDSREGTEVTA